MAFLDSFKELVWPECTGWGLAVLSHFVARGIDSRMEWNKPFRRSQDYVMLGEILGGTAAYDRVAGAPKQVCRGMVGANGTLVAEGLGDLIYGKMGAKSAKVRGTKKIAGNGRQSGEQNGSQMVSAEI